MLIIMIQSKLEPYEEFILSVKKKFQEKGRKGVSS